MGGKRTKHVPERSCISCRSKGPKSELIRIVRAADGGVEIDSRGRMAGRGAYLCRRRECWEAGLKRKRVESALRGPITPERLAELMAMGNALATGDGHGEFGRVKACDKELADDSAG